MRRWLCGLTPWTRHEYVIARRLIRLFEATCHHCGDHRWGHVDFEPLLPWTIRTEAEWMKLGAELAPAQAGQGEEG